MPLPPSSSFPSLVCGIRDAAAAVAGSGEGRIPDASSSADGRSAGVHADPPLPPPAAAAAVGTTSRARRRGEVEKKRSKVLHV